MASRRDNRNPLLAAKYMILRLTLVLVGLLAVLGGIEVQLRYPATASVVNAIGIALITAGVVDIAWARLGVKDEERGRRTELSQLINEHTQERTQDELGILYTQLSTLAKVDVGTLASSAHTIQMALMYDPSWGEPFGDVLEDFMARDDRNRIFVFVPSVERAGEIGPRHGLEEEQFREAIRACIRRIVDVLPTFVDGPKARVQFYEVPGIGPRYTGYLFDTRYYGPAYLFDDSAEVGSRGLIRLYRQYTRDGAALPTLVFRDALGVQILREDFHRLHEESSRMYNPAGGRRAVKSIGAGT